MKLVTFPIKCCPTLRELERYGLVDREIYPVVPPKVEHQLTALGKTLVEPLDVLFEWAVDHIDEVEAAIVKYDEAEAMADDK